MRFRDTVGRAAILGLGITYGAGMMFLLDPTAGRRRRALLRDKVMRGRNELRWFLAQQLRNAVHHLQGTFGETRAKVFERPVPDNILEQRVRAQIGHVVSHAGSLEVICRDGHVTIRGRVLAGERQKIEDRLHETRGVRQFTLEVREDQQAGSVPELQGESRFQRTQRLG